MDRAEGSGVWRVGNRELNGEDDVRVEGDRAVWYMEAHGTGQTAIVEAVHPEARRFVQRAIREKARIAQRQIVRPVPKPVTRKRRQVEATAMRECPQCDATGALDCPVCGGEGWVRQG